MEIKHYGQIARLSLPGSWQDQTLNQAESIQSVRVLASQTYPGLEIRLVYRGRPLSDEPASAFSRLLKAGVRKIELNELFSVASVLREFASADVFTIEQAAIHDFRGRLSLLVRGRWTHQDYVSQLLFLPTDQECRIIQEIHAVSPSVHEGALETIVRHSLDSIEWEG